MGTKSLRIESAEEVGTMLLKDERDICLIGISGCGKGTLTEAIRADLLEQVPYVNAGDIAREISKASRDQGAFAPSADFAEAFKLVIDVMRMERGRGILIDGFPRYFSQLALAERILRDPLYVWLDCPPLEAVRRMVKRGRQDDTDEGIERRLKMFYESTLPVYRLLEGSPCLVTYPASAEAEAQDQKAARGMILRVARWVH